MLVLFFVSSGFYLVNFFLFFVCNFILMWCLNKMMKCFPFYFHQKTHRVVFFSSLYSNAHSFLLRCFYFGHDWLKRSRFCAHTTMKKAKKKKKTKEMWSSISLIMTCIQVVRYYFGRCCGNNLKQNDMRSLEHNLIWWLYGNLVIASHTITVITPHTHTHIYFLVWIVGF